VFACAVVCVCVCVCVQGQTLGRLACLVAGHLRGANLPTYSPSVDMGGYVVVINAEKVVVSGSKPTQKLYRRHTTGRPGSMKVSLSARAHLSVVTAGWWRAVWRIGRLNHVLMNSSLAEPQQGFILELQSCSTRRRAQLCRVCPPGGRWTRRAVATKQPRATHSQRWVEWWHCTGGDVHADAGAHPGAHHREGGQGHAAQGSPGSHAVHAHEGELHLAVVRVVCVGLCAIERKLEGGEQHNMRLAVCCLLARLTNTTQGSGVSVVAPLAGDRGPGAPALCPAAG
jgi:hypothetical protein